jgi:hypothetical protein
MNERIRQLAEQAGAVFEQTNGLNDCPQDSLVGDEIEKFAELIVQECIDIIAPYTVRMSRPGEEYLHPISEIKKNFGVGKKTFGKNLA